MCLLEELCSESSYSTILTTPYIVYFKQANEKNTNYTVIIYDIGKWNYKKQLHFE